MDAKLFLEYLPWLREPKYKVLAMGLSEDYEKWALEETTPLFGMLN